MIKLDDDVRATSLDLCTTLRGWDHRRKERSYPTVKMVLMIFS